MLQFVDKLHRNAFIINRDSRSVNLSAFISVGVRSHLCNHFWQTFAIRMPRVEIDMDTLCYTELHVFINIGIGIRRADVDRRQPHIPHVVWIRVSAVRNMYINIY